MMTQNSLDSTIRPSQDDLICHNEESLGTLPPEIEYEIFILAFCNNKREATNLLRVAKRVAEWLIPMLYEVVVLAHGMHRQSYPPMESLQLHGRHVRHLLVSSFPSPTDGHALLSTCPNVSDLVFWSGVQNTAQILNLPITRLYFENNDFIGAELWGLPKTPQIEQWCSHITHLVLGSDINYSSSVALDDLKVLTLFPSLTHFMTFSWNKPPVIRRLLVCCLHLQVFVWLWGRGEAEDPTHVVEGEDECPVDDPRIVTLNGTYVRDWMRSFQGEDDFWILAEREIQRKRCNI
ncbi:hypothetical protein BDN72DRAFT_959570 [Pluteus cervinus]|uniref:Uncharacterized protein n=1 Tax=Pluteus cervinus TaxID=181527 RepID=A0ACD3AUR7_9AGAR|nr:hypothetical protein BDN72DRAFT_959570 [Pluteus cervinus]